MKPVSCLLAFLLLVVSAFGQAPAKPVTVPVTLDHNRTIIDVYFVLPDGTKKRVRGWVDPGNPEFWIGGQLAGKLGLKLTDDEKQSQGTDSRLAEVPQSMEVGGLEIPLADVKEARVVVNSEGIAPGSSAEVNVPSAILRHYDVVFDYPNREMSLGAPGSVKATGAEVNVTVNPQNGLVDVPAQAGGRRFNLGLDPGSNFSLLSQREFDALRKAHPQWPHAKGAVGDANFWGHAEEADWTLLRVPALTVGKTILTGVGVAGLSQNTVDFFQKRAGVETLGLIGANALLNYKVTFDYTNQKVYFDQASKYQEPGMDVVGLVLRPEPDGRYSVAGVGEYEGKPAVPDVKAGDILVSVDKVPAKGSTMGQIWSLLGGSPGDTRVLVLEREGKPITVQARVRRFLPNSPAAAKNKPAKR